MYGQKNDFSYKVFGGIIEENRSILIEKFIGIIFGKIDFDHESLQTLKEYSTKGHVVYATFHSSNFALLILYNLLKKYRMKLPVFALEYNPFSLQTFEIIWKRIKQFFYGIYSGKKAEFILEGDHLEKLIRAKKSIIISLLSKKFFLRRYLETKYDSLVYLIELQKRMDEPIYLFPQMIFWNMNPERTSPGIASKATGDRGLLTGLLAILKSITPAFARVLPPLNLKEEIGKSEIGDSEKLAIALRYRLFEIYYDEKRAVLGPVIKSRQEMMEKVLYQKEILDRIERLAQMEGVSVKKMKKRAYLIFREIAADYSILTIKLFSTTLKLVFNRMFNGISFDQDSIKNIREASKKGPLIMVPCHKSHMDYLIISHLFYENRLIPPHIAAGINLSFFPFGTLFRHSGAFFIRRSFIGQKLYMVIFRQYIRTLIEEGYSIEFFMEGGRTRTGKLISPQLGFLHFLIEAVKSGYNEDLVFVPISINYDRILEEKTHMKEIKGKEKEAESIKSVMKGSRVLKKTYGKVYVSFGEIFTLKEISAEVSNDRKLPAEIANRIFNRINDVTVVTSFAITSCAILLLSERGFSGEALKRIIERLYDYLVYSKARMSETLQDRFNIEEIMKHVLHTYLHDRILEQLKIVEKKKEVHIEDFYVLKDDNRTRIGFYKNNIIHFFVPIAFVSCAILRSGGGKAALADIKAGYHFLRDLFSREFVFTEGDDNIDKVLEYLKSASLIDMNEAGDIVIAGGRSSDLLIYSKMILDQIESYYVVIRTIVDLKENRIKRSKLLVNVRKTGYKMYHLGGLSLAESLSVPCFINAIDRFSNAGILKGGDRLRDDAEVDIGDLDRAREFEKTLKEYISIFEK